MANLATYTDAELAQAVRHQRQRMKASHKQSIGAGTMRSGESAEMLALQDAAAARLEQLAGLSGLQLKFLDLTLCIEGGSVPEVPAQRPPVVFITGKQTEAITRLCNHPLMPRPEKTQGLLRINKLNEEEAAAFIQQLEKRNKELEELPGLQPNAGPEGTHPALAPTSRDQAYDELVALLRDPGVREEERVKAAGVIGELSEAELREKIRVVKAAIIKRAAQPTTVAA